MPFHLTCQSCPRGGTYGSRRCREWGVTDTGYRHEGLPLLLPSGAQWEECPTWLANHPDVVTVSSLLDMATPDTPVPLADYAEWVTSLAVLVRAERASVEAERMEAELHRARARGRR